MKPPPIIFIVQILILLYILSYVVSGLNESE